MFAFFSLKFETKTSKQDNNMVSLKVKTVLLQYYFINFKFKKSNKNIPLLLFFQHK